MAENEAGQRTSHADLAALADTSADAVSHDTPLPARRAWMVRGTNVDGRNVVPEWLTGEIVTLSAAQLADIDPAISYEDLKLAVEIAYQKNWTGSSAGGGPATWRNRYSPVDMSQLRAPVPAYLQSQSTVVDLTDAYEHLAALIAGTVEESGSCSSTRPAPTRTSSRDSGRGRPTAGRVRSRSS